MNREMKDIEAARKDTFTPALPRTDATVFALSSLINPKFSRTGKPLCIQCCKLAIAQSEVLTYRCSTTPHVYHCSDHMYSGDKLLMISTPTELRALAKQLGHDLLISHKTMTLYVEDDQHTVGKSTSDIEHCLSILQQLEQCRLEEQKQGRERCTVKGIHQALYEHLLKGSGQVLCEIGSEYDRPFTPQVFQARTRHGILEVQTINGWKVPFRVFLQPVDQTT